jgi:hypothetical protein
MSLEDTPVTMKTIKLLQFCTSLLDLNISGIGAKSTDEEIFLDRLTQLTKLHVDRLPIPADRMVASLCHLHEVRSRNSIPSACIHSVIEGDQRETKKKKKKKKAKVKCRVLYVVRIRFGV